MKTIFSKYLGYVILLIIITILVIGRQIQKSEIKKLRVENNISNVLLDTVSVYKNKLGELTAEKQAFNVKFSDLEKQYDRLDKNSKQLVDKINALENDRKLIDATIITQQVTIDSLYNNKPIIDKIKGTLTFIDSTKYLEYSFLVNTKQESLLIQNLNLPNKLYISHSFSKEGVSVKVVNSNEKYFKTNDINSYVIPIPKKKDSFRKQVKIFGVGIGVGAAGMFLLTK